MKVTGISGIHPSCGVLVMLKSMSKVVVIHCRENSVDKWMSTVGGNSDSISSLDEDLKGLVHPSSSCDHRKFWVVGSETVSPKAKLDQRRREAKTEVVPMAVGCIAASDASLVALRVSSNLSQDDQPINRRYMVFRGEEVLFWLL